MNPPSRGLRINVVLMHYRAETGLTLWPETQFLLTTNQPCARSGTSAAFGVGTTVVLRWLCPVEFPTELQLERVAA